MAYKQARMSSQTAVECITRWLQEADIDGDTDSDGTNLEEDADDDVQLFDNNIELDDGSKPYDIVEYQLIQKLKTRRKMNLI